MAIGYGIPKIAIFDSWATFKKGTFRISFFSLQTSCQFRLSFSHNSKQFFVLYVFIHCKSFFQMLIKINKVSVTMEILPHIEKYINGQIFLGTIETVMHFRTAYNQACNFYMYFLWSKALCKYIYNSVYACCANKNEKNSEKISLTRCAYSDRRSLRWW